MNGRQAKNDGSALINNGSGTKYDTLEILQRRAFASLTWIARMIRTQPSEAKVDFYGFVRGGCVFILWRRHMEMTINTFNVWWKLFKCFAKWKKRGNISLKRERNFLLVSVFGFGLNIWWGLKWGIKMKNNRWLRMWRIHKEKNLASA